MRTLSVLILLLSSCSSSASRDTRLPGRSPTTAHPPAPPDEPPVDTCTADLDCTVAVSGADPADPCCDVTYTARPMSRAFLVWASAWRPAHCAGVACAAMPLPGAQLAPCGYEARCRAGHCASSCGEPVPPPPAPPS